MQQDLKIYFPQALEWFFEVTSQIAGDFLERWPILRQAQKARPESLRQFFRQHNSSRSDSIERRVQEIRNAVPATQDATVIDSCSTAVLAWARMLRELRETIASYDQKIETLARQHPDFAIVDSLPGVNTWPRARPGFAPRSSSKRSRRSFRDRVLSGTFGNREGATDGEIENALR